MAKKTKKSSPSQTYMKGNFTTPKCEAIWPSLGEINETSQKFEISTLIEDTKEWKDLLASILEFQNECLERDGNKPQDTLLCVKDVVAFNEEDEEWEPNGESRLIFKSLSADKFSVVGPDRQPIEPDLVSGGSTGGDTVRVNGTAAFGYFGKAPYVTLYLKAVQRISGGGASGVAAFDDETGEAGEDAPFEDEGSVDHGAVGDLA